MPLPLSVCHTMPLPLIPYLPPPPPTFRPPPPSQQIEIVQLVPVPEHVPLHLAPVHPGDEVLHGPRHQERRVRHHLRPHPHVALLHKLHRRRHRLRHPQPRHHHPEPPPREPGGAHFPLHGAQRAASPGQDAHGVEFLQHELFVLDADGVGGGEVGEGVG